MQTLATIHHEPRARKLFNIHNLAAPDVMAYCVIASKDYLYFRSQFDELVRETNIWYYWPAHMEKPSLHRVLSGCYLWKSKAQGIVPYCYQHLPKHPHSPYDDFDPWEPMAEVEEFDGVFRDHMLTYPAREGPVPTLQWEAFREGITDLRYLTTLHRLIEQAEKLPDADTQILVSEARLFVETFLKKIDMRKIQIHSPVEREPYTEISANQYSEFRRGMADRIVPLLMAVSKPLAVMDSDGQT